MGVDGFEVDPRMEKGSAAAGFGGAEKAEDMESGGWGVLLDEPEGAELKAEKELKPGGGVEVEAIGPRALEF